MINHALKSGVIIAVISIVISLLIYLIDATLMIKWWFGLISLVLGIALVSYFGISYRGEAGGYLNFKVGYGYSFVTFAISGFISTFFMFLMYNVIDPDLSEVLFQASMEQTEEMMRNFGAPPEAMDQALAEAEESARSAFTLVGQIRAYGIALILYAVLSLITGAIIRKKEPELT